MLESTTGGNNLKPPVPPKLLLRFVTEETWPPGLQTRIISANAP